MRSILSQGTEIPHAVQSSQRGRKTGDGTKIKGTKQLRKRLTHLYSIDFDKDSKMQKEQIQCRKNSLQQMVLTGLGIMPKI